MTTLTLNAASTPAPADPDPVLSTLAAVAVGSSGWSATVSTDKGNGTLFYYRSANSTESKATIEASGASQAITTVGTQNLSGLAPAETTSYVHVFQRDTAGNESDRLSDAFTTSAAPSSPGLNLPDVQVFHNGWSDPTWADPTTTSVVDFAGASVNPNTLTITSGTEYRNGTFSSRLDVNGGDPQFNNVVFRNITFSRGFRIFDRGTDVLFDNCVVTDTNADFQGGLFQRVGQAAAVRVRFRNCQFLDIRRPSKTVSWGTGDGAARNNRTSGMFLSDIVGLDVDGCLFDYIGWGIGYDVNCGPGPQPPSQYSHCLYIQRNCTNVTVRNNIISRGGSFGVQVRPGGIVTDNIFVDCNNSANALMANTANSPAGSNANQTYMARNIIAYGAEKDAIWPIGAKGGRVWLAATGLVYEDNYRIDATEPQVNQTPLIFEADTITTADLSTILSPANIRADHRAAWNAARSAVGIT
jgi:hypothetical protein